MLRNIPKVVLPTKPLIASYPIFYFGINYSQYAETSRSYKKNERLKAVNEVKCFSKKIKANI